MALYDSAVNEKMRSSPEFAEAENKVRRLERETNALGPRVDELTRQVADLERQFGNSDQSHPVGRQVGMTLDRARADLERATEQLTNVRAQLAEAIAERDAFLDAK